MSGPNGPWGRVRLASARGCRPRRASGEQLRAKQDADAGKPAIGIGSAAKKEGRSGKVNVLRQPLLAGVFQQREEPAGFGLMRAATEKQDQAGMDCRALGEREIVHAIAGDDDQTVGAVMRPNLGIGRVRSQRVAQLYHVVAAGAPHPPRRPPLTRPTAGRSPVALLTVTTRRIRPASQSIARSPITARLYSPRHPIAPPNTSRPRAPKPPSAIRRSLVAARDSQFA